MDDSTLQEFRVEADELLNEAEKSLLALDKGEAFEGHYNSVFRVFHSLKGAAGMLNLEILKDHMHKTENLFQDIKGNGKIEKMEIDFFLRAVDCARRIFDGEQVSFQYEVGKDNSKVEKAKKVQVQHDERPHVYIVDDEIDIVEVLAEFIQILDCRVSGFTNPLEALEAMKTDPPAVVLSDVHMPQMSGTDLMKVMHDQDPMLPFIIISGRIDKEVLMKSIEQGVYAVLEKPFQRSVVTSLTTSAMDKYKLMKLVGHSINMVMYQYADLEDYLISQSKQAQVKLIKDEISNLQKQFRNLSKKNGPF